MIQTNEELNFFIELISCNYPINLSIYSHDMEFIEGSHDDAFIFDKILDYSEMKKNIIKFHTTSDSSSPLVISDSFDLLWIATFNEANIQLLGPVFVSEYSMNALQKNIDSIDSIDIPLKHRTLIIKKMGKIPVVSNSIFFQYGVMLNYCVNREKIKVRDFQYIYQNEKESQKYRNHSFDTNTEHTDIYHTESKLLSMVENGDLNYKDVYSEITTLSRGVKITAAKPISQVKYSIVTFIALTCRAAIKGGLYSGTAYSINDHYIQRVEEAESITELAKINHEMFDDFVSQVNHLNKLSDYSTPIINAMNYIKTNIERDIDATKVAEELNYTPYYLSRKFKEEVGVSMNDYLQKERIEKAKLLLTTTHLSIEEIGHQLNFSSRSHFSIVFKKWSQLTPSKYRKEKFSY